MELIAENICKSIKRNMILDHINLQLSGGHIYGFVGINGAGKTMLFRALSGLIRIDSGQIRWNNQILHKNIEVLPSLGIVIENAGLYPNLTGFDNLKELADLRRSITSDDIRFAMNRVGLDPADSRLYKKYSLGMKQRLITINGSTRFPITSSSSSSSPSPVTSAGTARSRSR